MYYVLLRYKRILIMEKKQVWVFQYRRAHDDDYVEIFDKKPSRKFLDKLLVELLDFEGTTPAKERLSKDFPIYYEELYSCEVRKVAPSNEAKKSVEEKFHDARKALLDLYDFTSKTYPDTASVIGMAEDTLRKEKVQS